MMKISVVTPSFNQCAFLKLTLGCLLSQQGDFELEVLVIDGGSTDGSRELLQSIDDPRLQWVSEPDRGQSDAINKGLARATGDLVGWLNSDDLYKPGALQRVHQTFADHPEASWLIGRCDIIDETGREIRQNITRYKDRSLRRYSYRRLLRENFISQMAVFWRRGFGQQVGGLNLDLHYAMDYDLWLRMGALAQPIILDQVLASFRYYPQSKTGAVRREQYMEQYRIASAHFGSDHVSRLVHRFNVEKIIWAYRVLRLVGW